MGSVLGSFGAFQGKIWSMAPFIPVGDWEGPKISILPYWKIFGWWALPLFSDIVIDPKGYFLCNFKKFEGYVFEKNQLFCIPYLGPKRPFFDPGGPHLTPNLKNIVLQVVLTQNIAFQGWNWSPNKNGNFGVGRPPQTPPQGPPDPPRGTGGSKMAVMHLSQSSVDN